jgi:penicillin amidase
VGFFERPDPRLAQSADPLPLPAVAGALIRHAIGLLVCLVAVATLYTGNVVLGLHVAAATRGSVVTMGVYAPVTIVRDRRDVPHIAARNEHDLYFGEGYVQGSDRLFQLDLSRRYAYGRLAEILGAKALPYDEMQRAAGIDAIARRQLRALAPRDRAAIVAFSDGVNAAAATQPLPVEFRMLLYRPAPWTPQDSLAVSVVASLELAGSWHDVFARDAVWRQHGPRCFDALVPLSDARYDVTVDGARAAHPTPLRTATCGESSLAARTSRFAIGSNAWAAGAARSAGGAALLANDPHLDLTIPGIWYLVDLQSPQLHAAGATIPGIPGVVLGHNERVAWASANAAVTTASLFAAGRLDRASWTTQRFGVRFSGDVTKAYYRTQREFSIPNESDPSSLVLVRWPVYTQSESTIATALALDRARDVRDALRVLARYRGSPQSFILAGRNGEVAYHVAGLIPDDPAWGRYVHAARDLRRTYAPIPFDRLPQRAPSRDATLLAANNKTYESTYPYRLSAQFEAPYRAYRIAQLLALRRRYDEAYFERMQLDTLSPIDLEIARDVARFAQGRAVQPGWSNAVALLRRWDGRYRPASQGAVLEHALRLALFQDGTPLGTRLNELRDERGAPRDLEDDIAAALASVEAGEAGTWRDAGAIRIEHLLAPMHFGFLDGAWLPGAGDEYTVHLQEPGIAQGFRAVWDAGDWDRGGIAIPSGESGERGSGHYTDLSGAWVAGTLEPLPFSRAAIRANASSVLELLPAPQRATAETARRLPKAKRSR